MRKIVFWRHGRTSWNAQSRFQGQTDIPLDDVGISQANRAGAMLASMQPWRIISSDLQRAHRTATALADVAGLPVHIDDRLRETFAGQWEGLTRDEIEAQFPGHMHRWTHGEEFRPGVTGELRTEVAERVTAVLDDVVPTMPADATVVLVTHGGAARAGVAAWLGLPFEHWACLGVLSNCSWSVLEEQVGGRWRLAEYNAGTLPEPALGDDA